MYFTKVRRAAIYIYIICNKFKYKKFLNLGSTPWLGPLVLIIKSLSTLVIPFTDLIAISLAEVSIKLSTIYHLYQPLIIIFFYKNTTLS